MYLDSQLISRFLMGTLAVFAMVAIGGTFANMFRSVSRRFPFTKAALVLALPPFCLTRLLDRGSLSHLFRFAILVVVLGFVVDALKHLLLAWRSVGREEPATPKKPPDSESGSTGMVWEKAE